ncbi:LIM homeobox transcription factor 1-beta [Lepeophtheirus salmonis]|uniref:LIM homeobox transcription factor 1-beta n=1 Tax=Lepeophtheirus salmonis TaxID=72036 RepID=UPI001AE2F639|nr:LIM homeobox transcription factor 1-beta-like [Lepeophtheirus salmonis]
MEPDPIKLMEPGTETCEGCCETIYDRYVMRVSDSSWHEDCLYCSVCRIHLTDSCYFKDGRLFCRTDYERQFGIKCGRCSLPLLHTDLVMRTVLYIYHSHCFVCTVCCSPLQRGDQYVIRSGQIVCRTDFEKEFYVLQQGFSSSPAPPQNGRGGGTTNGACKNNVNNSNANTSNNPSMTSNRPGGGTNNGVLPLEPSSSPGPNGSGDQRSSGLSDEFVVEGTGSSRSRDGRRGPKRPRTILTAAQRRQFKASFEISPKPCRKVREALAKDTGLSVRVVQVWFQNQRAKMKKIQRRGKYDPKKGGDPNNSGDGYCDSDASIDESAFDTLEDMGSPGMGGAGGELMEGSHHIAKTELSDPSMTPGSSTSSVGYPQHPNPIDKLYLMQDSYFTQI